MKTTLTVTIDMDPAQMARWARSRGIAPTEEAILADLQDAPPDAPGRPHPLQFLLGPGGVANVTSVVAGPCSAPPSRS